MIVCCNWLKLCETHNKMCSNDFDFVHLCMIWSSGWERIDIEDWRALHFNHVVIFTLYVFVCLVFPASPVEFCRKCCCHLQSSFEEVTVNIEPFSIPKGVARAQISSAPPMPSTLSAAPELGNDYFLSVVEMPSSLRLASMLQVHFHIIIIDYFT